MQQIKDILSGKIEDNTINVNNVNNNSNNNVNNVDSNKKELLDKLLALLGDEIDRPKAIAQIILEKLGDNPRNLNFHIKMVKKHKQEFLFECLSIALDASRNASRQDPIRNLPKYYVGVLKRRSKSKPDQG